MSSFSSPTDEFGTNKIEVGFRKMSDIADEFDDYYLVKEGISTITRKIAVTQDKPLYLRAGVNYKFIGSNSTWLYTGGPDCMFRSCPLKEGVITGFSDNTTNTLVTTNADHNLQVGDLVRIIDSRVYDYNGIFEVLTTPISTTFTIDVEFSTVDGQCRFSQTQLNVTVMADSTNSTQKILTITLVNPGTDYVDGETVTIGGTSGTSATATIEADDDIADGDVGDITKITLLTEGDGYTNGDTVSLTGASGSDATATITAELPLITLTIADHVFTDNISINIEDSTNGLDGTYVISNVTDDTVDIPGTFTVTGTALADVGLNLVTIQDEIFQASPPPVSRDLIDFESMKGRGLVSLSFVNTSMRGFVLGEARGFTIVEFTDSSKLLSCGGMVSIDNIGVIMRNIQASNPVPSTVAQQFLPCIRFAPGQGRGPGSPNIEIFDSFVDFSLYNTFIEIPSLANENALYTIRGLPDPSPGTIFAEGYRAKSTGSITDSGSSTIVIPVSDTIRYRIGDSITIDESDDHNYDGVQGFITAISLDTSITVDITYVAASDDDDVIFLDTTLVSKDGADPQVTVIHTGGLPDSTVTANSWLNTQITTNISQDIIVDIGGTWDESNLERMLHTEASGVLKYVGLETRKLAVQYGATATAPASQVYTIHLLLNGNDVSDTPPTIAPATASSPVSVSSSQIIEIEPGQELKLGIKNVGGSSNPTITEASMLVALV